jgi:uncharacterized protein
VQNPTDRCYLCKTELLELAAPISERLGLGAIFLGTNLDDLGDHRPGLAAADERGAVHPMVEAGLSKPDVRELSRLLGLRTWDKPQLACLSSRFPYGTEITPERLDRVDRFEDGLRALDRAFRNLGTEDLWILEDLYYEKATMLDSLGDRDAAVAAFEAGLERCPGSVILRAGLEPLARARVRSQFKVLRGGLP